MRPNPWLTKIMTLLTALALSGLPAMAQATTSTASQQPAANGQDPGSGRVDPAAGPKTPVPSSELPETPQPAGPAAPTAQAQPVAPAAPSSTSSEQQKSSQEPLGTATAERGATAGGPASKPAGMAIAPAQQKQTRSLLIKIGAVAAAGAALGLVYVLTRGTPSTPPNSGTATNK